MRYKLMQPPSRSTALRRNRSEGVVAYSRKSLRFSGRLRVISAPGEQHVEDVLVLVIRAAFSPLTFKMILFSSLFRHIALLTNAEMHEMQEAHVQSILVVTSVHADFASYSK